MANIFINGNEVEPKKDFDEKVNLNYPMLIEQQIGYNASDLYHNGGGIIQIVHAAGNGNSNSKDFFGNYDSQLIFGSDDVRHIFNVATFNNNARLMTLTHDGKQWSEDIAWKSDITNLQSQINDLKKQIGGVLSSLLSHLVPRKVARLW